MPPPLIGKYKVVGLLGQGAMGEVYLAEDPHIGRRVAIKVMRTADADDHKRFVHEAQIVGALSHPNIVVLHDFGFQDEKPYLVMEYVSGSSLEAWLKQPHSLGDHLRIMEDLLSALAYAHERGVLHRDIKPSNVQVMPGGQCKLMDFGIARAPSGRLTATGMVLGTPSYLAPEILEDVLYSPRSDIYSAGVVLYEMLAGTNPFVGQNVASTLNNALTLEPPPLAALRREIPPDLSAVVMACLAKDPKQRPRDLSDLQAVIRRLRVRPDPLETVMLPPRVPLTRSLLNLPSTRRRLRRRFSRLAGAAGIASLIVLAWAVGRRAPLATAPATPAPPASPAPSVALVASPSAPPGAAPVARPTAQPSPRRAARTEPAAPPSRPPAQRPRPSAQPSPSPAAPATPAAAPPADAFAAAVPQERASPPPTLRRAPELAPAVLTRMSPRTTSRGVMITLEVRGTGLRREHRARVLRGLQDASGIHVTRQAFVDATRARVTLLVDEDAPIGIYSLALVDPEGRFSNSLSLEVIL
jgi:serine/threonine-protein kinase